MTTLRPFGPSVALTAAARTFMPLSSEDRASSSNLSCFGILRSPPSGWGGGSGVSVEDGQDVFFLHDQVRLVVDLHFLPAVLAEQVPVASLDVERQLLALVGDLAVPDGDDLALL